MFHDTEQKIVDRLKAVLGTEVYVDTLHAIESVPELRQKAPAVWVIYDGFSVGSMVGSGSVQQITQEWFVVIAAKSAKGRGDSSAARDEAGEIALQVLQALLGFHLGGGKYLHLSDAPGPEYSAGYAHLPLAFTNAATFKGQT
jgi:hypothetical protein